MPVHTYVINVYNNEPLIKNCKTETTLRWISFSAQQNQWVWNWHYPKKVLHTFKSAVWYDNMKKFCLFYHRNTKLSISYPAEFTFIRWDKVE